MSYTPHSYGEFYSTNNQSAASATTAYPIELATTLVASGITSDGAHTLTFSRTGVYRVNVVIQFANSNQANIYNATIWAQKNGANIANSASQASVSNGHGGAQIGGVVYSDSFLVSMSATDTLVLYWQAENVAVTMEAIPAGATPVTPASASAAVSISQTA